MSIQENDFFDWAKYQWEFKRRSPDYKKFYEKHIKEHGAPSATQPSAHPDPALSFDEIIKNIESSDHGILGSLPAYLMILPKSVTNDFGEDGTTLNIEIDFRKINSIESLKKYVIQIIDDAYFAMKKLKALPKRGKKSMVDYDICLQVGDLRRQGKKNREIAAIIDPRKYDENPESAIRLIAYYHKRYLEFVDGGYMDIVYP